MTDISQTITDELRKLRPGAEDADANARLSEDLGLTSMKMVLLLTSLCQRLSVPMTALTEADLAAMTTPALIEAKLARLIPQRVA